MSKAIYTAQATVTGGRAEGHGVTSDGALDVQLRAPAGDGVPEGTNPEQLFAVGYAACFEGALAAVARRERIESLGEVSIASQVSLHPTPERGFKLGVELHVTLPGIEDGIQAAQLVHAAHQVCPYSQATRGNIEVLLTANGEAV
jgi:lipoyl-dependent peroxiredoxin